MFKAVFFDHDGTLVDNLPTIFQAMMAVFAERGLPAPSEAALKASFGPSEEGVFPVLMPDDGIAACNRYIELYQAGRDRLPALDPEWVELLSTLKARGCRLGLVSGKGIRTLMHDVAVGHLGDYFDFIRCGSSEGDVKVPNLLVGTCELGVPCSETVYIGDSISDIKAAKTIGMAAWAALWHCPTEAEHFRAAGADRIFTSVAELSQALLD